MKAKTRCPACGEELDGLKAYEQAELLHYFNLNERGEAEWEYIEPLTAVRKEEDISFGCPHCQVVLCLGESEAVAILKGEFTSEIAQRFIELALEDYYTER